MKAHLIKSNSGDWKLVLQPEDDTERAIAKELDGASASLSSDVQVYNNHIADALVISKTRAVVAITTEVSADNSEK